MNSRERRLWRRLPLHLKEIMTGLHASAVIESFDAFGRSWQARIQCSGRRFELVSSERDLGYISVSEIVAAGKRKAYHKVLPPDDQLMQITPAQVCELIRRELGR